MFSIDESLRGIPVAQEQVIVLYQSLNSPHLVIPGRPAGVARAYVLGIRAGAGFAVCAYLFLAESNDCAIYVSQKRAVRTPEEFRVQEAEALAFVESMGFLMDNLNFRQLSPERQAELIRTLPLFQKDPQSTGGPKNDEKTGGGANLARLFSSF